MKNAFDGGHETHCYKGNVFVIPYAGEEAALYRANCAGTIAAEIPTVSTLYLTTGIVCTLAFSQGFNADGAKLDPNKAKRNLTKAFKQRISKAAALLKQHASKLGELCENSNPLPDRI